MYHPVVVQWGAGSGCVYVPETMLLLRLCKHYSNAILVLERRRYAAMTTSAALAKGDADYAAINDPDNPDYEAFNDHPAAPSAGGDAGQLYVGEGGDQGNLRPRSTSSLEDKSKQLVECGGLRCANMNAATLPGVLCSVRR